MGNKKLLSGYAHQQARAAAALLLFIGTAFTGRGRVAANKAIAILFVP